MKKKRKKENHELSRLLYERSCKELVGDFPNTCNHLPTIAEDLPKISFERFEPVFFFFSEHCRRWLDLKLTNFA